jgi:hypothetical protein
MYEEVIVAHFAVPSQKYMQQLWKTTRDLNRIESVHTRYRLTWTCEVVTAYAKPMNSEQWWSMNRRELGNMHSQFQGSSKRSSEVLKSQKLLNEVADSAIRPLDLLNTNLSVHDAQRFYVTSLISLLEFRFLTL